MKKKAPWPNSNYDCAAEVFGSIFGSRAEKNLCMSREFGCNLLEKIGYLIEISYGQRLDAIVARNKEKKYGCLCVCLWQPRLRMLGDECIKKRRGMKNYYGL